jgi:hypothetical protein
MTLSRVECGACDITVEGQFGLPRLARLGPEAQGLIEAFVLAGGSLKLLAEEMSLSYPTVRKRIDGLIAHVRALAQADEAQNERLLKAVETGTIKPEKAARLMRETAHG